MQHIVDPLKMMSDSLKTLRFSILAHVLVDPVSNANHLPASSIKHMQWSPRIPSTDATPAIVGVSAEVTIIDHGTIVCCTQHIGDNLHINLSTMSVDISLCIDIF